MSCMSGSPNLNRFRDRGQVAVQLVSCGVPLPGVHLFYYVHMGSSMMYVKIFE